MDGHTLDTQQIQHLQQMALETQKSNGTDPETQDSSGMPFDAAQRTSSSNNSKIPDSQYSTALGDSAGNTAFRHLPDSMAYHAEHLNAGSSQISDVSPSASLDASAPRISTFIQGASIDDNFKVPSFPSISSIMRNSSDENGSSLAGIGEAQTSLSQFFNPTQESPRQPPESPVLPVETPQVYPSPQLPTQQPSPQFATPTPEVSKYVTIRMLEEQRKQRDAEAEAKRKAEHDNFTALPPGLQDRWKREEKAHKLFEDLRNTEIEIPRGPALYEDPALDDFMFGTKSRLDPDGVRRVIRDEPPKRAVSERGEDEEEDTSGGDSRKRASTAPVGKDVKGSFSTVISNSQPSNESHHSASNGHTNQPPQDHPILLPPHLHPRHDKPEDQVTPLRQTKDRPDVIPSSIPSTVDRSLETPYPTLKTAPEPLDLRDSVPETSPAKPTQTEDFITARSTFPPDDNSSPVVAHAGRRRAANAFVASSIPRDFSQGTKRRSPTNDLSDEEPASSAPRAKRRKRTVMRGKQDADAVSIVSMTDTSESTREAHRVLARFKDQRMNYFPATVVEPPAVPGEEPASMDTEVLVQFDDGLRTMVALKHIRRFELREGDCVKIWMEEYKRPIFTVLAVVQDGDEEGGTDCVGNNVVVVVPKSGGSREELRLPMEKVYVTGKLFAQFEEDRRYLFTTTTARNRFPGGSRHVSSSPSVTRGPRLLSTLFENMVFAISGRSGANPKNTLSEMIMAHGGRVLENGLHDILNLNNDEGELVLRPGYEETTFCAVLADEYSRRVKYLQALALGLPCLATKWIEHCVKQNRIIDWRMYLLPAGESTYLGAIKSIVMDPYPIDEPLAQRLTRRPKPLSCEYVILISRNLKQKDSLQRNYHFILTALGCPRVAKCSSLEEADGYLTQGGITMICADQEEIKRWRDVPKKYKIQPFENVIQGLILGSFIEELGF